MSDPCTSLSSSSHPHSHQQQKYRVFCSVLPSASPLPPLNKTALQTKLPTGKFIRNFCSYRDLHGRWHFFCKEFLSSKNGQDTCALSCLISCFFFNFISSGSLVQMFFQFQNVKIYQASIQFSSDLGNTMHFCLELSTMKASWDHIRYEYAVNASVNSTCAQPPHPSPGYCGAFACLVSPGGGAFANFALPGGRAFANAQAIPELLTRTWFPIRI